MGVNVGKHYARAHIVQKSTGSAAKKLKTKSVTESLAANHFATFALIQECLAEIPSCVGCDGIVCAKRS
jgi:hypothetical protein